MNTHLAIKAALAPVSLLLAPTALIGGSAPSGGLVLVPHAPWQQAQDIVDRAGGRIIGPALAPMAAFAEGGQGFTRALRDAGAWAVTDATRLAILCNVTPYDERT